MNITLLKSCGCKTRPDGTYIHRCALHPPANYHNHTCACDTKFKCDVRAETCTKPDPKCQSCRNRKRHGR